jgi:ABC transport system ATP-binding/permease protein
VDVDVEYSGMALISCQDLRVLHGERVLLDDATLQIEEGERIGLVGRNGEGKSTLLHVLAGSYEPDGGTVVRSSGLRVSLLAQHAPTEVPGTVESLIRAGLHGHSEATHPVQRICSILQLDPVMPVAELSGGQRRRAFLGQALASEPDLLLLDEPTNHLDMESIQWLEGFLARHRGSLLFVTHDRAFLQRLASRILELDRGRLTSWECDYPTFLRRKDALLEQEEREWVLFDKNLAKEEEWIRQGVKARRTRNEGRVKALERLRAQRAARRERVGRVKMSIQEGERSGKRVILADNVTFGYGESLVVKDFSATILRGDKVGVIGPNGCGKTTLLNLLLGSLEPTAGTVGHGVSLQISYFDQQREELEESRTLADTVAGGSEHVVLQGQRRHILGYLKDFLFQPERAREPVSSLSGGERNRLLLARLFARPANVLVLDEPTNDLDVETLELLETLLLEFEGTVLAVSHDRSFLDNLCSSVFVFEGEGVVREYVGGYSDWQRSVASRASEERPRAGTQEGQKRPSRPRPEGEDGPKRLSFRERREWESLPGIIEELERELEELHQRMADPDFFREDPETIREASSRAQALPLEIEAAFARWGELDERA